MLSYQMQKVLVQGKHSIPCVLFWCVRSVHTHITDYHTNHTYFIPKLCRITYFIEQI